MKTHQDYGIAFEIVRAVIAEWDPYSLLGGGAQDDEFDREVAKLLTRIHDVHSADDAAAAISAVFSASFMPEDFPVPACAEVGARLYARLAEAGVINHDA
jgi:hypothetical protein